MKGRIRIARLDLLIKDFGRDGLKKMFEGRMAYGETFTDICESFLIPYNLTAVVIGYGKPKGKYAVKETPKPQPSTPAKATAPRRRGYLRLVRSLQ